MAEPTRTPTKLSKSLNLSPSSKSGICIICGLYIDTTYRRKLFLGSKKTDVCILIEKVLSICILRECTTHTACRKCVADITRTDNLFTRLLSSYRTTATQLYRSHGRDVTKRLRQDEETSSKESRRKSLFKDSDPEVCAPLHQTSTLTCQRNPEGFRVTICLQDGVKQNVLESLGPIAYALTTSDYKYLSGVIFQCEDLQKYLIANFCHQIQKEVSDLCSKQNPSILRQTDSQSLLDLSFEEISHELKQKAPTFWTILQVFSSNPSLARNKRKNIESLLPSIVTAGSKLISAYNRDLNAIQHLNSILLLRGGAKKSLFQRLSATGDCCAYNGSSNVIENFSKAWNHDILNWKAQCEEDHLQEKALWNNVQIWKETVEVEASPDTVLLLDDAARTLQKHQTHMHPGFYFVGDNVDFYTKVRHMTLTNQNKSQHMFQICAYLNRVSGNHLDDFKPKNDPDKVKFSELIPSLSEQSAIKKELALLVAWKWTEFIPSLFGFSAVLPDYICHKYMKEMKTKTSRRNLGVLEKNEQYNSEMIDICQFIHQFVPNHDLEDSSKVPLKTLSGGDYLTFERHKRAQQCRENGRTPSKSLQGLIPKMEEFHNQAEFLKLIWSQLYKSESFKCIGTLAAAKNRINAKNVPADSHDDYYASAEFMDKVTAAYIVSGGLQHFKMENLDSQPTPEYDGPIGDQKSMRDYIIGHALGFVEQHGIKLILYLNHNLNFFFTKTVYK